ncbi:TonB-dependent receptor plug domain-containing protein [Sphingomonas sp.]|uniref:TonB-dependent receptor plug domain-containing protein n=1 Tax=Sphingomonas sp. TaxID=28214 RepID=UPI00345936A0
MSVTVLSNSALSAAKIETGTEIARQTPNLRVSNLGDESQPKFSLRGISTPEFNLNAISPTGVFADEVYIGASYLGGAQLYRR